MPKKAPKNAFFYFMHDFKAEQQQKGINYGNLTDVAKAADPEWRVTIYFVQLPSACDREYY